jgi:hypothetical protein
MSQESDNYDIKSIDVNDHNEANCYTVVGDYLYYTCIGNFKKRDLATFEYINGNDGWVSKFDNKHQYNKFNKTIFMIGNNSKYLQCFNTVDQTFLPLYNGISGGYFNYGISEDGKVIYVLDNGGLYQIDADPIPRSKKYCSLDYYANDGTDIDNRLTVTNSGKIIHFSLENESYMYINIYDPKSGDSIKSEEIESFGKLIYLESDQKVVQINDHIYNQKEYVIYDSDLKKIKIIHADCYSSNFYRMDYYNYKLDESDIDGNYVKSFSINEVKEDWELYTSKEHNKMTHIEYALSYYVCKVEDIIIISNQRYRFLYHQTGNYLGRVPMQLNSFITSPIHFSSDRKHLIELGSKCIYNYDITCLQHREQKVAMIAVSPVFVKGPLFDRNLLPLIFEFLPKGH